MVKCNRCGMENKPGSKFCGSCGAPILTQSPVQATPLPLVSPPPPPSYQRPVANGTGIPVPPPPSGDNPGRGVPPPPPGWSNSAPFPSGFTQGFQQTAGNPEEKTVKLGWKRSKAAIVCYVFGWLSGIIMYFVEPDPFVRFHAVQSTAVFLILMILSRILPYPLTSMLSAVSTAFWVFLMYKASKGELYKLPLIGDMAENFVAKK